MFEFKITNGLVSLKVILIAKVSVVFSRNDKDGDGKLSKQEFKDMMMKEKKSNRRESDAGTDKLSRRDSDIKSEKLVKRNSESKIKTGYSDIANGNDTRKNKLVKNDSNITKEKLNEKTDI